MLQRFRSSPVEASDGSGFFPLLAGATVRGRMLACLGVLAGISCTGMLCAWLVGKYDAPLLAAPIGASALLLFVVPSSPLAQPWPIIGGNVLSALVGLISVVLIEDPSLRAGAAVASAILIMSLTRALHPPGGACALAASMTAIVGISPATYLTAVALNSTVIVLIGIFFHKLRRQPYPQRVAAPTRSNAAVGRSAAFLPQDLDVALARMNQVFDVDKHDLERLLQEVALASASRSYGEVAVTDIMSREVVCLAPETTVEEAKRVLLEQGIRALPVVDADRRILGVIGLRELSADEQGAVSANMTWAPQVTEFAALRDLLPVLVNDGHHAVMVVDESERLRGIVTQTDLLAVLGYRLVSGHVT
ncbi:HPP family protein [Pusillimonas sp. CC-YST705]|uniref:HPP family protein n=1 Tax=Mesopusillimonas faecipullorum TaxID=2755040 RepID=A0ABS8CD16_9BURK|nr:HPP family protein [Mesopusillimonas faecipullorum]MCB5363918.1 HPP family protein [Mesopusillimonas faecipullorum]